ncbi:hypothetical protein [Streptosporangium roseum]|uniref:hypothetical protein n=1 Tax=Streptosporangium roseum TaxID=2001 RepID=UPI00031CFE99|nr:hypothetical protein [Streptosporangium roseum]
MSGGERARSWPAAAPEVLLLDDPANDLGESAPSRLEEHLRTRPGTAVAVSRDRVSLGRAATGRSFPGHTAL